MAFSLWLTGLPASGKSTIARALVARHSERGVAVEVLESDAVRRILTPEPTYAPEERDLFYRALAFCGARLAGHGVNVLFDATANRRAHRALARALIPDFLEVLVDCPLATCQARDAKGTYALGQARASTTVPGLQDPYEPPLAPDLRLDTSTLGPEEAAQRLLALLEERRLL